MSVVKVIGLLIVAKSALGFSLQSELRQKSSMHVKSMYMQKAVSSEKIYGC